MESTIEKKRIKRSIQERKLMLIEQFMKISDSSILDKLEDILSSERDTHSFSPMKIEDFYKNIDQALDDVEKGNVISHQELKKRIKTWK